MGRGQTAQDSFSKVFGERRGHSARLIADHDWRALLISPNAEPEQVADALFGDTSRAMRHSGIFTLERFGVSGDKSRQVVRCGAKTLHLLPLPFGEQTEHVHPTALCGKMLESFTKTHTVMRGSWLEAKQLHLRHCARCAKRAEEISETKDVAPCSPFFPDEQDEFDVRLKESCRVLAETAQAEQLAPDEVEARADLAYMELLGVVALTQAEAHPRRCLRAAFSSQECYNFPKVWGYPGAVEDLLGGVDWEAIFTPLLDHSRYDGVIPTVFGWEEYRQALLAQLEPLAKERANPRRIGMAQERLVAAQAEFEAAQGELALAQGA